MELLYDRIICLFVQHNSGMIDDLKLLIADSQWEELLESTVGESDEKTLSEFLKTYFFFLWMI